MRGTVKELLDILAAEGLLTEASAGAGELSPSSLSANSREVSPGALFICKGFTFKKEYLDMAVSKGASLFLSEERFKAPIPHIYVKNIRKAVSLAARWFYGYPGERMSVTGITGTKGKTTTAYILKAILDAAHPGKTAVFSTMEIDTGRGGRVSHLTTPEPVELQSYFNEALENGCTHVVMEVSSQAMKLSRVYGERFPIGIFLNVDEDHIGGQEHATLEEYVDCKTSFLTQCDTVIVNRETRFFDKVLSACEGKRLLLYGHENPQEELLREGETVSKQALSLPLSGVIRNVDCGGQGSRFELGYEGHWYAFESSLVGRFNVENLTAAILAAFVMGIDPGTIQEGIRNIQIPGRMAVMEYGGFHIVVDFAHNYLSFLNLYHAVMDTFAPKRIRAVFGSAGERSGVRRRDMGLLADRYADCVYLTEDDPGHEDPEQICEEIRSYIKKPCVIITDREQAIRRALSEAQPGDVVLLAGKGSDTTMRVGSGYVPYISDAGAVKKWIAEQKRK